MTPFTRVTALACPLPIANIDTDQLIPARFMRRTRKEGYGPVLLHDLRFEADGTPKPDFPLNRPEYQGAGFIIARRNFGSGSSREAAVYALADYGIRAVIAPSFGDIFAQNAVNNGLLPVRLSEEAVENLILSLSAQPTEITLISKMRGWRRWPHPALRHRSGLAHQASQRLGRSRPHAEPCGRDSCLHGAGCPRATVDGAIADRLSLRPACSTRRTTP